MLTATRRHVQDCSQYGTFGTDCPSKLKKKCPLIVHWYEGRKRREKALGTNDPKVAAELIHAMVLSGDHKPKEAPKTVRESIASYFEEEGGRGIGDSTLKSFRKFLTGNPNRNPNGDYSPTLVEFADRNGIVYLRDFTADLVAKYRQEWRLSGRAFTVQSERLKQFFKHAFDMKWIPEDYSKKLKPPKVNIEPVIAFSQNETDAILNALAGKLEGVTGNDYLLTFNLVMRFTGLATVDAIRLGPQKLHGEHIITRRTKTDKRVKIKIPPVLIQRLEALPIQSGGYWFWNQKQVSSKHETATGNMRRMMRTYFKAAQAFLRDEDGNILKDKNGGQRYGHLYQWRHTFVNEHLIAGTPVQQIAEMIGDTVMTVMKTYAHMIEDRQKSLDHSVEKSWNQNELAGFQV